MTDEADIEPAPRFDRRIPVGQVGDADGIGGMLVAGTLGGLPGLTLMVMAFNADAAAATWWRSVAATLGMIGGAALSMLGMFAGMIAYFALDARWAARRGKRFFTGNTRVRIDEDGLMIEALGLSVWSDVLGWEGVPESEHSLVVHTSSFGRILLSEDLHLLVAALEHHQAAARAKAASEARDGLGKPDFAFTALVFHWPRFRVWIWAGYLLAGALALELLSSTGDYGALKTLATLIVVCPLLAWSVWMIPMSRFDLFAGRATRAFRLKGHRLEMRDHRRDGECDGWCADLRQSRVIVQAREGLIYDLSFITIVPERGRRLDLVVEEPERATLIEQMHAIGVQLQVRCATATACASDAHLPIGDLERHARENRGAARPWRDD